MDVWLFPQHKNNDDKMNSLTGLVIDSSADCVILTKHCNITKQLQNRN